MADKDDLLGSMDSHAGGGSTEKLLNPGIKSKLDKYWGAHTVSTKDESVEMMRARNTAIRLGKNVRPRGEPEVAIPLGSKIRVKLNTNSYWDGLDYLLTYPRDRVPGQMAHAKQLTVTATEAGFFAGGGWLGKDIRKAMEEFWGSVSKDHDNEKR